MCLRGKSESVFDGHGEEIEIEARDSGSVFLFVFLALMEMSNIKGLT